jgi:hypothetical protein
VGARSLSGPELAEAVGLVERALLEALPEYERNYVAAMVELACARRDRPPPAWTTDVRPLERPRFGTELKSVRPHLLRASPVPFKRRNIFIDAPIALARNAARLHNSDIVEIAGRAARRRWRAAASNAGWGDGT